MSDELVAAWINAIERLGAANVLARLAYWLAMAARGSYAEAGESPEASRLKLRSFNELFLIVGNQTLALQGSASGYPDDAFVRAMLEQARVGDIEEPFVWAIRRALNGS